MGRVHTRVSHRDALQDHRHALPNGEMTSGMLLKPSTTDQWPMHTHLYEFEEETLETGPMHDEPGHVHSTGMGETSGNVGMAKQPGEAWKKDTADQVEDREHKKALERMKSAG